MDYDKTKIAETYNQGRDHGPAFLKLWMDVLEAHVEPNTVHTILDLGCGTGRFSRSLAERFNATVVGLDPSMTMLRQAFLHRSHSKVFYACGQAEAAPMPSESVDLIFISMIFHHLQDPFAAARECRRLLRSGGRVCIRTATLENIPNYPYVPFFPASRALLEEHLPSLKAQRDAFEAAPLKLVTAAVVSQQIAADSSAYADKLSTRSDSILARLDLRDFESGIELLRESGDKRPIIEPIDFLVFEKV